MKHVNIIAGAIFLMVILGDYHLRGIIDGVTLLVAVAVVIMWSSAFAMDRAERNGSDPRYPYGKPRKRKASDRRTIGYRDVK